MNATFTVLAPPFVALNITKRSAPSFLFQLISSVQPSHQRATLPFVVL